MDTVKALDMVLDILSRMSSTKRYSESEVNECIYAIIALRDRESENK